MKTLKMDFKITPMEIQDGQRSIKFVTVPPIQEFRAFKKGDMPEHDSVTMTDQIYDVQEVRAPGGERRYYLLQRGDREFLEHLFAMANHRLDEIIHKEVVEILEHEESKIRSRERKWIASLPWYRRLFKTF